MGAWLIQRKVLLVDLDNTLYDWVSFFAPAIRGMCQTLSEKTEIPANTIWNEMKAVFAKHGSIEYSFAIQELPSLHALHPNDSEADIVRRYRSVIDVFQHRRRAFLRPYPGVIDGIHVLRRVGYEIIGVTDSRQFQAQIRLKQLRLDGLLHGLCCVADHAAPDEQTIAAIRRHPNDMYVSKINRVYVLPEGVRKPSPVVLDFIISMLDVDHGSCIYTGDSLSKDVFMAQSAGVYDCWASYGARVSPLDFATLVRLTDWPASAVRDAMDPSPKRLRIFPSFTADSFDSIVELALMEPRMRPNREMQTSRPRQMALFEVGPTLERAHA